MPLKDRMRQTVFISDNAKKLYKDIKNKYESKINELKADISKNQELKQQEVNKIQADQKNEMDAIQASLQAEINKIQKLQEDEIKKIKLKYQKEIDEIKAEHQKQKDETRAKYQEVDKNTNSKWDEKIKAAEQKLSTSNELWSSALKNSDIARVTVPREGALLNRADIFVTQSELNNPNNLNPDEIGQKHAHSHIAVESLFKNINHIKKDDPRVNKLISRLKENR